MHKEILFDAQGRSKLRDGIKKLASAVKSTLGPSGKNVVIKNINSTPLVTKDGVTVAKEVVLKDIFENLGASLVKEAASKTSDSAGDGTTTATVLAEAIFDEGNKLLIIANDCNPTLVKKGIDLAVSEVVSYLKSISQTVTNKEQIAQVATISANNDSVIGNLIAEVMSKVGKDGVVSVEDARGIETEIETVEGLQFDKGFLSPYFITNPDKGEADWTDVLIFLYDSKLSSVKDLVAFLQKAIPLDKPIVIIAEDIEGDALTLLAMNRAKTGLKVLAVKAPGFGDNRKELLQDIAVVTGSQVVSRQTGHSLENLDLTKLGSALRVKSTKDRTIIIDGNADPEKIKSRIASIKMSLENASSEFEKIQLRDRLAKLSGGVAVIRVGAASEIELKEKKARVEDAMFATRAAVEEGFVPGGGVALLRATKVVSVLCEKLTGDELNGARIVEKALKAPIRQIIENGGLSGTEVINKILENDTIAYGYNARTSTYEDLVKSGVIDPTKVVRSALQNAASVAGTILTTSALMIEIPESKPDTKD